MRKDILAVNNDQKTYLKSTKDQQQTYGSRLQETGVKSKHRSKLENCRCLTSFFSTLEKWKSLLFFHAIAANELIPFPNRSTAKEVIHGNHDRAPYFLMSNTYKSGLKINITSPVKYKPPGIPFSDKKDERLGLSAADAVITKKHINKTKAAHILSNDLQNPKNYFEAQELPAVAELCATMWAQKLFGHFHQIYLRQTLPSPQDSMEYVQDFSKCQKPLAGRAWIMAHLYWNHQIHSCHLKSPHHVKAFYTHFFAKLPI